jgi:hypothetical protein
MKENMMSTTRRALLLGGIGAATLSMLPGTAEGQAVTVRSEWWRGLASTALQKFQSTDAGSGTSFGYGHAAGASGILNGWTAAPTNALLTKLLGTRFTNGGYGLGVAWDAFGDGTTNASSTIYTVTVAGHVGPFLLAAYRNQSTVVARADVQNCISLLMNMPRVKVPRGVCLAYSNNVNDNPPVEGGLGQVHNVNAGAAAFLADANSAGFGASGMQKLITDVSLCETIGYNSAWRGWPYEDKSTAIQDADHDSYTAESMYGRAGGPLAYWVGREAVYRLMTHDYGSETRGPIAHTRLGSLGGGPGSWSTVYPGTSLWSEYVYTKWKTEQEAYASTVTGDGAAQFAWFAAQCMATVS